MRSERFIGFSARPAETDSNPDFNAKIELMRSGKKYKKSPCKAHIAPMVILCAMVYAMVLYNMQSLVVKSASVRDDLPLVVNRHASSVAIVVPGHGTPRRLPSLKKSLFSLRKSFRGSPYAFKCWVFVYERSHTATTLAALPFCTVIYNTGLWTDHMRLASRMIGGTFATTHVILMMDDVDATQVHVPEMIRTMNRVGYAATSPSLPSWQTSSSLQRAHCLAHRSDHIDILFTVFTKSAWDCWASMIHDGISNRHGWGFDLTFSEYCGNIPLGIIDHEVAFHDPDKCPTGGDCEARSYDSNVARKEMDHWIMTVNPHMKTAEEADAYFKHVAFLRPTTFNYCDLIQLNLPSEQFYKTSTHRGGWKTIMQVAIDMGFIETANKRQRFNRRQYLYVVDSIEEWFLWKRRGPIQGDWIGITHMLTKELLPDHQADDPFLVLDTYFDSEEFAASASSCAALVFFTTEVEQSALKKLRASGYANINTCVIRHPIAVVEDVIEFDLKEDLPVILSNRSALILLGQQYRRVATLHKIKTGRKKIWLPSRTDGEYLNGKTQRELTIENVTADPSIVIERVESNREYDRLIKQNIVVIDFWAATANNAVMEAIALKAPFFIRRLPGPEEYLGTDYPLFFSSVEELEELLSQPDILEDALTRGRVYLQSLDTAGFSIANFAKSLDSCALIGLNSGRAHPGSLPPGVSPVDTGTQRTVIRRKPKETSIKHEIVPSSANQYFGIPAKLSTHEIIQHIHRRRRTVLMFSPYDFSTGGGEKYFLEVARFFQSNDYTLTISSYEGNHCQDKNCILKTAKTLGVDLSPDFFYFLLDYPGGRQLRESQFDIYYEMGNSKFIQYGGPPGAFTIYQCQFPFDTDNTGSELNLKDLQTVDVVIVNSEYTKSHYLDQTQNIFSGFLSAGGNFPNVEIVHPPVSLLETKDTDRKPFGITVISMLGRIFQGRQSKGHMSAVEAVRSMDRELRLKHVRRKSFELHIIGNVHPGFDDYAKNLTRLAKDLPITFHLSVSREELRETLAKSHFIWHLTGIDAENDPASNEHFGISLVEAMSVGAIPIHFHKGGAPEASKGCGYEISDVNSLVQQTIHAMQLSEQEFEQKSATCKNTAKSFSVEKFGFNFERLLARSRMTRAFFAHADRIPHLQSRDPVVASPSGKHSAYIYVHAPSIHVPNAVRNVMKTLGRDWNLYVGVQPKMRKYVEPLFANVQNARFLEHPQLKGLVSDYSKMMMSTEFWDLFDTEYVLIFQPDCVMFYNDMNHFISLGAPLLGAPWCMDNEVFVQKIVQWRVGNGGLSLRRKSWMKRCIESEKAWDAYNGLKNEHGSQSGPLSADNEDIFFNVCVKEHLEWEELWKFESEAAHFAVEVPCGRDDGYMKQGIMAGHAFWYYTDSVEHQKLLEGQPPERNITI